MSFKLIVETPTNNNDFEYIVEEKNANQPRNYFIKGPFMMAEGANRNRRIYSLGEMKTEVDRYTREMIKEGRAMGELNHPTTADVDLTRACHIITELKQDGNVFYGKSKILSTPTGLIVRSLIEDGVKIGVSTRGLGQLVAESNGVNRVKDFRLVAVDVVADPSFDKAFVNGILESKQYVLEADGSFAELYDKFEKGISTLPNKNKDEYLRQTILSFINKL
jgi:Prohead core protein serine protease